MKEEIIKIICEIYEIEYDDSLSEEFIKKFADRVNWRYISQYQKLSEEFIEKFVDKVNWNQISRCQKLSEKFIDKFSDKVHWDNISAHQKLFEEFIKKHADKVDWDCISRNQKLSKEFIEHHELTILKSNWMYKDKNYKLNYIKKNTNYKIIDDEYIIAYKTVREDNYSVYNFQYKYEIGGIYEAHCNCIIYNDNSFGLSAWTKEKALDYYSNGKLLKVKIMIDDIGVIVQDNKKIRCFKLEVLEEVK